MKLNCHNSTIFIIVVADGLELKIKPLGGNHVKAQGQSIVFTCLLSNPESSSEDEPGDNEAVTFKWLDSDDKEILDKSGR